uniref:Uncharacterized protein n=1 Tax=Oryza glumipatula TaxID=40148 RepID=A0A0E0BBD2_9ORYZ
MPSPKQNRAATGNRASRTTSRTSTSPSPLLPPPTRAAMSTTRASTAVCCSGGGEWPDGRPFFFFLTWHRGPKYRWVIAHD